MIKMILIKPVIIAVLLLHYSISKELFLSPNTFSYTAIKAWNTLPNSLKSIDNLAVFKRRLKESFLSEYTDWSVLLVWTDYVFTDTSFCCFYKLTVTRPNSNILVYIKFWMLRCFLFLNEDTVGNKSSDFYRSILRF